MTERQGRSESRKQTFDSKAQRSFSFLRRFRKRLKRKLREKKRKDHKASRLKGLLIIGKGCLESSIWALKLFSDVSSNHLG